MTEIDPSQDVAAGPYRDAQGQFRPGVGGRSIYPKAPTLRSLLDQYGRGRDRTSRRTRNRLLTEILWAKALGGESWAIQYIYDRVLGRPKQTVEHEGEVPMPMIVALPYGALPEAPLALPPLVIEGEAAPAPLDVEPALDAPPALAVDPALDVEPAGTSAHALDANPDR